MKIKIDEWGQAQISLSEADLANFRVILNRSIGCPNRQVAILADTIYTGLYNRQPYHRKPKYRQIDLEEAIANEKKEKK